MTSTVALSSAGVGCSVRTMARPITSPSSVSPPSDLTSNTMTTMMLTSTKPFVPIKSGRRRISCEVALRSNNSATSSSVSSATITEEQDDEEELVKKKIGARVRVKVPLKVYHVPRVPEVDLIGKEGQIKQYVAIWKGKQISANLPYKVQFVVDVEGRGPVKFVAHLKEDEFEYLD